MVKAYFDSLLEEATLMAAMNSGFGHNGSNNSSGMIDSPDDGKDGCFESFSLGHLPLHLGDSSGFRASGKLPVSNEGIVSQFNGLEQSPQSRPTRESVLKRLYDALMRRSLVKVS